MEGLDEQRKPGAATRRLRAAALLACAAGAACGGGEAPNGGDAAGPAGPGGATPQAAAQAARGVRLLARREIELAGRPIGLVARDLDGDGTQDLIVATRAPGTLQLLHGGDEGLVLAGAPRSLGGDYPLAPLDLGAHGLAVALQDSAEVLWFAAPVLDVEPVRVALAAAPCALGAGDVDGDGEPEIVVACADDTLAVIALEAGSARIASTLALPFELHGRPTFVAVLPTRIAIGAQLAEALFLLPLDEPGSYSSVALGGIPRACVEHDLDGDGDPELVIAGGDRSVWALGLGAPGGHAAWIGDPNTVPRDLGAPGAIPVDLERADLDGDGRAELVLVDFYDSGYGVLGAFDAAGAPALVQKEYAGQDPVDAAIGDFDGDGQVDLAIANRGARRVSLLLGSGFAAPDRVAFYQSLRTPVAQNPTRVRAANLDDDPLPEAVVLCAGDRVVVARNNRFGLLAPDGPTIARDTPARALFAGARRPGEPASIALLEAGETGARLVELARRGDAFAPVGSTPAGAEARDVVALRARSGLALVCVDPAGRALHAVAPGEGEARRVAFDVEGGPLAACAVDVDGDGADELAVATARGLHLLDGALAARAGGAPLGIAGHTPKALAAGDVDGDGTADVVVLYAGERDTAPGRVAVFLGDGAGAFRRVALVETGLAPAAIAVGDVDGDGRAEIFCAAQNSHNVNVWTPKGGGDDLLRRLADVGAGLGPLDVWLVDLDGDGRLDLLTANNFSHDLSVAYNLSLR